MTALITIHWHTDFILLTCCLSGLVQQWHAMNHDVMLMQLLNFTFQAAAISHVY